MSGRTPQRVLVTGGAGFVGSGVVRSYLEGGAHVRVLFHRNHSGRWHDGPHVPPTLDVIQLDLLDLDAGSSDVFAGQDLVIHAAAVIGAGSLDDRVRQRKVNVDGTRNVIDACRRHGVPRLVYVGTTAAIGISPDAGAPADEHFSYNLDHLDIGYNLTKREAERLVLAANGPDLEALVVSPGFIFGWNGTSFHGAEVIRRVLRRPVVICTVGGLSIVHVDDVVEGIRRVAERGTPGEKYILSGENVSFRQIAETVSRVARRRRVVIPIAAAATDIALRVLKSPVGRMLGVVPPLHLDQRYAHRYYSSEKAVRQLGYAPRPFAAIVAEAIDPAASERGVTT